MPNYTITQIEDAVLAALKQSPVGPVGSGYAKTIEGYEDQLEAEDLEQITAKFPAIFVVFEGDDYERRGGAGTNVIFDHLLRFIVLVATRDLRGGEARMRGKAGTVGAYKMMDDVRDLLAGKRLFEATRPVYPVDRRLVVNTEEASVYALTFEMRFDYTTS